MARPPSSSATSSSPLSWSQNATNIVAQKYFRGPLGTPQREHSVRQMVDRVAGTITRWGGEDGYFATDSDAESFQAELTHLLVNQKAAFNSPVWFNVGVEPEPQCSACQPYDALVSTPTGMVPIGELVERRAIGTSSTTPTARPGCGRSRPTATSGCTGCSCATARSSRPPPTTWCTPCPSGGPSARGCGSTSSVRACACTCTRTAAPPTTWSAPLPLSSGGPRLVAGRRPWSAPSRSPGRRPRPRSPVGCRRTGSLASTRPGPTPP